MTMVLPVSKGNQALVDDDDWIRLSRFSWNIHPGGYASRVLYQDKRAHTILLHREVMNAPPGTQVDHIDGNKLDCRKSNLRFCNYNQNGANCKKPSHGVTSRFKGVYWNKNANKYQANIMVNKKTIYLGIYDCEIAAAQAYNKAASSHFGEFARLNKIDNG
jgi:hypothetical protein